MKTFALISLATGWLASVFAATAAPFGTAFTYSGRLMDTGAPATGTVPMIFALYDAANGGTQLPPSVPFNVPVINGLFTVDLDFGAGAFNGEARWLQITVNGTPLTPRQRLAPTPHAIYATTAGAVPAAAIAASMLAPNAVNNSSLAGGAVTSAKIADGNVVKALNGFTDQLTLSAGVNITLTPSGNGLQISAPGGANGWGLVGNTAVAGNFLGTLNNVPLELKANNARLLKLEPNATSPNLVGGWNGNSADAGVSGATIAGGGAAIQFSMSASNRVTDNFGTVGGGAHNLAGNTNGSFTDAYFATVGGGHLNAAKGGSSTVGGGANNEASANNTTVAGGYLNAASGPECTVGGGNNNVAGQNGDTIGGGYGNHANGSSSTVGGGYANTSSGGAAVVAGGSGNSATNSGSSVAGGLNNLAGGTSATVAGGDGNRAMAAYATIGGGTGNQVTGAGSGTVGGGVGNTASGDSATVPGGSSNLAQGRESLAAGRAARALHDGSFVWADRQGTILNPTPFDSTAANQFSVRASGGFNLVDGNVAVNDHDILLRSPGDSRSGLGRYGAGKTFGGSPLEGPVLYGWEGGTLGSKQFGERRNFAWYADGSAYLHMGGAGFYIDSLGNGTDYVRFNPPPGDLIDTGLIGARLTRSGVWQNSSDRNRKTDFDSINPREVLAKVSALAVRSWRYTNEARNIRHIGPMAQDFKAAFGLGTDDKSIGTIDADGVALAAIQGLAEVVQEQQTALTARNAALQAEVAGLKRKLAGQQETLARWEARFAALEQAIAHAAVPRIDAAAVVSHARPDAD